MEIKQNNKKIKFIEIKLSTQNQQTMNKLQQQQFIYFFDELCEAEEVFDKLKIDLLHRQGYNPHLLFELLSQGNEEIIISQMRRYLSDRISCSHRQLYELFEKFDSRRNGYISRDDFVRQLTPFGMNPIFRNRQGLVNAQIQSSFLQIIIEMLKRFRIIDEARKQIALIQPWQAFSHLDCWKKGIIGLGDLEKFYNDNDFQIGQSSLQFLLHALRRRYHRDVTLELFCQTLNPLQFGQYPRFAHQMNKENEKQFLKRSRMEEQIVKRSRVQNKQVQYEIQRAERRKKAEIQRQLNLQHQINFELSDYDRQQQQIIRKAILQQERQIRNRSFLQQSYFNPSYIKTLEESSRFKEELLRQKQMFINPNLSRKIAREDPLFSASKQKAVIDNQIAIQKEIQRQKQAHRILSRKKQEQANQNRLKFEEDVLREKQFLLRQMERENMLKSAQPQPSFIARTVKQSRIEELEHELERTRTQMKQRRQRLELEDKRRLLQTSTRSKVSAFPY